MKEVINEVKQVDTPTRVLTINEYLNKGKNFNLDSLSKMFNVSKRTIQRDMDELKLFYADKLTTDGTYRYIYYDHSNHAYRLM